MTIHEYFMKAIEDDARRAGERDRLLLEARRARRARRQHLVPAAPARSTTERGKIVVSETVTLDAVIKAPRGAEGSRPGGWLGPIGNSPHLAKLTLDDALAAGALLLGRRSDQWLAARWPSRSRALADRRLAASDGSSSSEILAGASPGQASGRAPSEQQVARRKPQQ